MNKPAPKEPSMDEILSSIRQIIADDDDAPTPRRPSLHAAPDPMEATPVPLSADEPLTLSTEQIVSEADPVSSFGFEALLADAEREAEEPAPELVVPDDVSFAVDSAEVLEADLPTFNPAPETIVEPEVAADEEPVFTMLHAVKSDADLENAFAPENLDTDRPSIAEAAPMPDATLSAEIAEGLLEPATKAAVRSSIGKLNAAGIGVVPSPALGNGSATIESMIRDMLRPMLKEWLDENLPSVVERMVEKEISRVSRGE
jgi:cell pole-organizing protein PopZ